jgi:hypothetical protein
MDSLLHVLGEVEAVPAASEVVGWRRAPVTKRQYAQFFARHVALIRNMDTLSA